MHLVENIDKDQISAPSSFKYRIALDKQVKNLTGFTNEQLCYAFICALQRQRKHGFLVYG